MAKADKEQQVALFMEALGIDKEEAERLFEYDRLVDKGEPTPYDLTPEQQKAAAKYKRADRKPTTYKFNKRERRPNATKGSIIAALERFLAETADFSAENIEIVNKERQIRFQSAGETFELTLVQKRKPKS